MTSASTSEVGGGEATPASAPAPRAGSSLNAPAKRAELLTDQGKTSIADSVVAKIAGLACREVAGVHEMGAGMKRTFGVLKDKLPIGSSDPAPARGVDVEVGERQAAVDLDIVVEYGAAIVEVAASIRRNVIAKVEGMTGLQVTEVNVTVDDVYLGESEDEPRVQ
jgi:uncharacterized alkaline shock family protein YloU